MAMKVGELRSILDGYPDDAEVILGTGVLEWASVARVLPPLLPTQGEPDRLEKAVCVEAGERIG